jgi:hypothetical protein
MNKEQNVYGLNFNPVWELRQCHYEEIKRVMVETGTSFRKLNGKEFWELAKDCGHTSLDFDKCDCNMRKG